MTKFTLLALLALYLVCYLACASPTGSRSVPVLLYHRIGANGERADQQWVPLDTFETQMRYLAEHGYSTLTVSELLRFLRDGTGPPKGVCITLDDGWRSQLLAVPLLRRHGLKATFLVFPEAGIEDPYGDFMSWDEALELARDPSFEIGSHSMTHPWDQRSNLFTWANGSPPGRDMSDVRHEIVDSKHLLEQVLGRPVPIFAWPMGWYSDALIAVARSAGYQGILTVDPGTNRPGDDPLRIKRLFVDGSCTTAQFAELLESHRYPACASGQLPPSGHEP